MMPETDLLREARDALEPFASRYPAIDANSWDHGDDLSISIGLHKGDLRVAYDTHEKLTAALSSTPEPAALEREGWQLVPVEPTEEMLTRAQIEGPNSDYEHDAFGYFEEIWQTMLSAVPPPPATLGEPQAGNREAGR